MNQGFIIPLDGATGATGATGSTGATGAAGPNTVSSSTSSTLDGVLQANGSVVGTVTIGSGLSYSSGTLSLSGNSGYPPGLLYGLGTSRPTTTSIAINGGKCRSDADDADIVLATAITKTQAAWAVGSSQGGLDSGSTYTVSTWYYIYVIRRSDTGVCDAIFSTSKVAPTYPTGYDSARRVGAFFVNSGGTIDSYIQVGDFFTWQPDRKQDLDTTSPALIWTAITLSVPPIEGILARVATIIRNTNTNQQHFVGFTNGVGSDPTDRFLGEYEAYNYNTPTNSQQLTFSLLQVNNTGQIKYRSSSATNIRLFVNTPGWIDSRGRG